MFANVTAKPPSLSATLERLNREAADRKREREARDHLPMIFKRAIELLYFRISNLYLLEFLMFDVIHIESRNTGVPTIGMPRLAIELLTIAVGDEIVEIKPFISTTQPMSIFAKIDNARNGVTRYLCFNVAEATPRWQLIVQETGLRKLVEAHLPERLIPLDERVFRTLLNEVLTGPQPLFSVGSKEVSGALSHLLDFVTSDAVRRSLALGVSRSASRVARQVALTAPVVKRSALKALPGIGKAPLLIADMSRPPPKQ